MRALCRVAVVPALLAALSWGFATSTAVAAPHAFITGFDVPVLGAQQAGERGGWPEEAVDAGAGLVRIGVSWAGIAPAARPSGFEPSDPSTPGYDWTHLDAAVREAAGHGLKVMFTVGGAPAWAEAPGRPASINPGAWRPRAAAFGAFAQALATRYGGSFPDPLAPGLFLPRVRYFEAWNEPNLDTYLAPQWVGRREVGAGLYRSLLNGFYAGVKSAQPGATVLGGSLAPFGDPPGGQRTPPVEFLRSLLCLKGAELKRLPCPRPAHLDAFSDHPIAVGAPLASALSPLDASTPDIGRLTAVLRRAERQRLLQPAGRRPLWVTEFWYDSDPPDPHGVPIALQARWYEQALYLFWRQGAQVALTLQLRDSPRGQGWAYTSQSGVLFVDGKRKPAFTAFRFPLVASPSAGGRLLVWGIAPEAGRVEIQARSGRGWRTVAVARARGRSHPFLLRLRLRLPVALRALQGGDKSLVWKQG